MIQFHIIDVLMPNLDFDKVRRWIDLVVEKSDFKLGELHYFFCSDDTLLNINRDRLGHDFYTDIVTFPLDDCMEFISSEFCISLDRVAENCLTFGRTFESELLRVMIHGVLHLIGFDDLNEKDQANMRLKEEESLIIYYNQL
ncbi:MAG: rRNA maturation RNase YbeY [Bacteroidales bacterium]|nr:rRNA maturation RNase YbeY [Bacteroidales bacterium]